MAQEEPPDYVKNGDIYNTAVKLSLEFGENFKAPIQDRLQACFPGISEEEADSLDEHCRELMSFCIRLAEKYVFEQVYSQDEVLNLIKQAYPKLESDNLRMLFAEAEWFARK